MMHVGGRLRRVVALFVMGAVVTAVAAVPAWCAVTGLQW